MLCRTVAALLLSLLLPGNLLTAETNCGKYLGLTLLATLAQLVEQLSQIKSHRRRNNRRRFLF